MSVPLLRREGSSNALAALLYIGLYIATTMTMAKYSYDLIEPCY